MVNRIIQIFCVVTLLAGAALAAGKGPEIQVVDGKVSMQVEAVPLGRLLRLLDEATGLTSKVPPELANRNVSVRFTGLDFDAAVRKIFQGQPLDYIVISGKGIVVTSVAQSVPSTSGPAPFADSFPAQPNVPDQPFFDNNPQPAVTQTPFGPIPAAQPNPQGQQGAFGAQGVVGAQGQQALPNPFGIPTGAGSPPAAQPSNQPLFGNINPAPFNPAPAPISVPPAKP